MPAILASCRAWGDPSGQQLVVRLFQLGVARRVGRNARFLERGLVEPAADPTRGEGHPGFNPFKGHTLDRYGVDPGVPTEFLVVRREVHGLLCRDEWGSYLSAPDAPDVRPLATKQLGTQLVGIDGGTRARQTVDGRRRARLGIELGDLFLEEVNGFVTLVGEQAQVVGGGGGCAASGRRGRGAAAGAG